VRECRLACRIASELWDDEPWEQVTARHVQIARDTGAQVLTMPPSVGGVKEVTDYFKLFDYDVNLVVEAIKKSGAGK